MNMPKEIVNWLLEGDPSIVWQVERDLLGKRFQEYSETRKKIPSEGWGKQILEKQDPEGTWAKGLYSPKWISTNYTLILLRRIGLPHNTESVKKGVQILLEKGKWPDGGINYFKSRKTSEECVTAMVFSTLCYFRVKDIYLTRIFDYLKTNQMKDGGWNCELDRGATHSSLHTTLMVLEALHQYKKLSDSPIAEIQDLQNNGHEFLLKHELYKSHRTGVVIDQKMLNIVFPPRWKYNILTALDYFQSENHEYDQRFEDAINLVIKKGKNGKWTRGTKHTGKVWFDMEVGKEPSRWNTLRALRVLKWWNSVKN